MFPDFSALSKMGDTLTQQFDRIVVLLEKISEDTAATRKLLEEKTDGT